MPKNNVLGDARLCKTQPSKTIYSGKNQKVLVSIRCSQKQVQTKSSISLFLYFFIFLVFFCIFSYFVLCYDDKSFQLSVSTVRLRFLFFSRTLFELAFGFVAARWLHITYFNRSHAFLILL